MAKRVHEVWKGSNKFIFGGRLIFGPDAISLPFTISLIVVPMVIFCVFVARHLRHKFASYDAGYAILVVAIAFTIYVLVLLLLTSGRDPGIVPRASHPPEEEFSYDTSVATEPGGRQTPSLQFPRSKEVIVNGQPVKVKYCDTCMVYRPPRCSHCSICDNCVERFDHHCPYVGQCIGQRNYRYFLLFVSSATLLCIYVFAMSAWYIKFLMDEDYPTVWKAMRHSPASVALMIYCFITLWFVGGLTGFHLYLITSNQTTYENLRYKLDNRPNPYDRGCMHNFREVFCTKIKPSRNNFRAYVQEEVTRPQSISRSREIEHESDSNPRSKVEDDLELGGDLLRISQRRNFVSVDEQIVGNSSRGMQSVISESDLIPVSDAHISSRGRSSNWEISSDVLSTSAIVNESSVATRKESQ
ncbi:protein S-acyltransferase 8-like [Dioscorea cayenensis subsp. rotundata]|uniref:S-acyltransferase n=1 Tax=Dioscorea cayennensis subsp. rotundata TaxID=55577 RepID=A0AB40CRF7_DIOCR|nr:protein S-acyltransferase 8-like [Dioscorea cayenensis subsp. rotundata]